MENQQIQTSDTSNVGEVTAISSDPLPSKKKKWIKGIVVTIFSLIVLNYSFFYLPHVLNLFTKDISQVDYSDLKLEKVVVADNDNAFFDLQKIENVLYYPDEMSKVIPSMASGKEWNTTMAQDLILKNTQTFEYLKQALGKTKLQYPQYVDPDTISVDTPAVPAVLYRKIARIQSIKVLYLLEQKKNVDAINEAFLLLSFGQKITNSQSNLINYLIGISIKNMGIEDIQKIINASTFTTEELKKYSDVLNEYNQDKASLISALKIENYINMSIISNLNKDINSGVQNADVPFNSKRTQANAFYYFKEDKTKKYMIDDIRNKIIFLDEPCSKELPETKKLIESPGDGKISTIIFYIKLYFTENAIGKLMAGIINMPYSVARCKTTELPIKATQLIISIKAFKSDNGDLPNTLNDLIPNYLQFVPIDPYDGKSLRYSKEKKIIYSVGSTTEDVGGSDGDNWQQMKNPTFKFDF